MDDNLFFFGWFWEIRTQSEVCNNMQAVTRFVRIAWARTVRQKPYSGRSEKKYAVVSSLHRHPYAFGFNYVQIITSVGVFVMIFTV
jgi:hypothetical protein